LRGPARRGGCFVLTALAGATYVTGLTQPVHRPSMRV
jgi:hypothetical protein